MLQENKDRLHIGDVQLRQTPLEEVFMAVAQQAETEHAQRAMETSQLHLQDGKLLQVGTTCIAKVFEFPTTLCSCNEVQRLHVQDSTLVPTKVEFHCSTLF